MLLNRTSHMPCLWATVNRRNMQYFMDLKRRTPILDVPPLIGQGTDDQAETQPAHHRVLVGATSQMLALLFSPNPSLKPIKNMN